MARFDPDTTSIQAWARGDGMREGLRQLAEPIRDEAERLTRVEAFNTGLMAASWHVETNLVAESWTVSVYNDARSPEGHAYPVDVEYGHITSNGSHVDGKRILGRAIANTAT